MIELILPRNKLNILLVTLLQYHALDCMTLTNQQPNRSLPKILHMLSLIPNSVSTLQSLVAPSLMGQ
jgi:hypothetical protein